MAKARIKSNGCRRGAYKRKKMGKGWLTDRKVPGPQRTPARRRTGGGEEVDVEQAIEDHRDDAES